MQSLDLPTLKKILGSGYSKIERYLEQEVLKVLDTDQTVMVFDGGYEETLYGSFYVNTNPPTVIRHQFDHPYKTNNVAEYLALIHGLEYLVGRGVKDVTIYGDSQLVVNQVNEQWRSKTVHLTELRDYAWSVLRSFDSWRLEWRRRDLAVRLLGH